MIYSRRTSGNILKSVNAKVNNIVKDNCFVLDDASLGKESIHIDKDDCICVDDQYSIGEKSSC